MKSKPKKQSGPKASTIAGRLMNELENQKRPGEFYIVRAKDLATLCASVLSQDEIRGQSVSRKRKAT